MRFKKLLSFWGKGFRCPACGTFIQAKMQLEGKVDREIGQRTIGPEPEGEHDEA